LNKETNSQKENKREEKSNFRLVVKWVTRLIVVFIALFFLLNIVIRIPSVQHYGAQQLAKVLSNSIGVPVSIDGFLYDFKNILTMEGVLIEDYHQDTLLYADKVKLDLRTGLWALRKRRIEINEIFLTGVIGKDTWYEGEQRSDLSQLLLRDTEPVDTTSQRFDFSMHALYVEDIFAIQQDLRTGESSSVNLANGSFDFKGRWIIGQELILDRIMLQSPQVNLVRRPGNVPDEPAEKNEDEDAIESDAEDGSLDEKGVLVFPLEGLPEFSISEMKVHDGRIATVQYPTEANEEEGQLIYTGTEQVYESIEVHFTDIAFDTLGLHGRLVTLSGGSSEGLDLVGASINRFVFSDRELALENFGIRTRQSKLGDTIRLKYRSFADWSQFKDRVLIQAKFQDTELNLGDLVKAVPAWSSLPFFMKHENKNVSFSGEVLGRVNNLRLSDFLLKFENELLIEGDISTRNLAERGDELLNMKISRLNTSMASLRRIVPGFQAPANFNKLGKLSFNGRFDGYFQDFVAYGYVKTDLGEADLDMRLDVKDGMQKAAYSGDMQLMNFDLGRWTDNPDFGKFSFQGRVRNGTGLRAETAKADLDATISVLDFKGYRYSNIKFEGHLKANLLDGTLNLNDENIKLAFAGTVDFSEEMPEVDFSLEMERFHMKPLGLSERDFKMSTSMVIKGRGSSIDNAVGLLNVEQVTIVDDKDKTYSLESLTLSQDFVAGTKQLLLKSSWVSAEINGQYSFLRLPGQIQAQWYRANPQLWDNLKLPKPDMPVIDSLNQFAYDIRVTDGEPFFELADLQQWSVPTARLQGNYNSEAGSWNLNADIDEIKSPSGHFNGIHLSADYFDEKTDVYLEVDTFERENIFLTGSKFYVGVEDDSAVVDIIIRDPLFSLDYFEARMSLAARDSLFAVHIIRDDIQIDGEQWVVSPNNELVFGKNFFTVSDFYLSSGKKEVGLFPMGRTGLVFDITSFSGDLINLVLRDPKFRFDGNLSGQFRINNLFKREGFSGDLTLEPFIVNGDDHGILMVTAEGDDFKNRIDTEVQIFRQGGNIKSNGFIDLGENADPERIFYFDIAVTTFPMVVLDYLVPNGLSNTTGQFSGQLAIFGGSDGINLLGELELSEAATTIDLLGARYFFNEQRVVFKPSSIDFSGATIKDIYGNEAYATGGITHRKMRDFGLNIRIQSSKFMYMDSKKGDNPDYYGRVIGRADIRFTGDFINPNIYINATADDGTSFVIPVDGNVSEVNTGFVRFVKADTVGSYLIDGESGGLNLTGVNLSMDLEVRPEAEVKIIFDESQGNIMQGYGRGNIQLNITRNGEFNVRGEYIIEQGDYLFTLMNFVNKPFTLRRGGVIRWTGDPLDAQIDIEADYTGLRTSLTNFLAEFALTPEQQSDAQRSTEVSLTMKLTGSLLSPSIDFSLAFPNVPESLRSYVDSKVRNLNANKDQLNTQVFGLLVFRSFLPSNDVSGGILGSTVGSTVGTISEMLANQFSNIVSALLSEAVDSWEIVSGVDFNIDYNQPIGAPQGGSNDPRFGELAVSQSVSLLNDRWVVTLGANYGNDLIANNRYFTPQAELSWKTPVDGLNLQVYYRTEQFISGLKQKAGVGFRYYKEFETLGDLGFGAKKVSEGKVQ
jgi:hypothetical protein